MSQGDGTASLPKVSKQLLNVIYFELQDHRVVVSVNRINFQLLRVPDANLDSRRCLEISEMEAFLEQLGDFEFQRIPVPGGQC